MKHMKKFVGLITVLVISMSTLIGCNTEDIGMKPYTFGDVIVNIPKEYEIDDSDEGGYGFKGRYPYVRFIDPKDNTNNITIFYEEGKFDINKEEFDLTGYDVEILSSKKFKIDDADAWLIHSKYENFDDNGTLYFHSLNLYLEDKHTTIQTNTYNSEIDIIMDDIINSVKVSSESDNKPESSKVVSTPKPTATPKPTPKPTPTPEPTPEPTPDLVAPEIMHSDEDYNYYFAKYFTIPVPHNFELIDSDDPLYYVFSDGTAIEIIYTVPTIYDNNDRRTNFSSPTLEAVKDQSLTIYEYSTDNSGYFGEQYFACGRGDSIEGYYPKQDPNTFYSEYNTFFNISGFEIHVTLVGPGEYAGQNDNFNLFGDIISNIRRVNFKQRPKTDLLELISSIDYNHLEDIPVPKQEYNIHEYHGISIPVPVDFVLSKSESDSNKDVFYFDELGMISVEIEEKRDIRGIAFVPYYGDSMFHSHTIYECKENIVKSHIDSSEYAVHYDDYDIIIAFDDCNLSITLHGPVKSTHEVFEYIFNYIGKQND